MIKVALEHDAGDRVEITLADGTEISINGRGWISLYREDDKMSGEVHMNELLSPHPED